MQLSHEGDYIENLTKVIFDVKGLVHPPERIVAFPRFVPDPQGSRKRKGITYRKVYALPERFKLLEERFPHYLVFDPVFGERLCEVPEKDVQCHYNPVDRLQELRSGSQLDPLEADALLFMNLLHSHSSVPWDKLGISGSLLARLYTPCSDIDPIIYGTNNCFKVYKALKSLMKNGANGVKAYTKKELKALYKFRSQDTKMSFEDFVATDCRKVLQGKFLHHDFFIRCVKDWNEVEELYGDIVYGRVGYGKIKAIVSDDSEAIFTPCRYSVDHVRKLEGTWEGSVTEVVSFRGRFCEQAKKGETIVAQGKVEKVQKKNGDTFLRFLLGGKPSDHMILEG